MTTSMDTLLTAISRFASSQAAPSTTYNETAIPSLSISGMDSPAPTPASDMMLCDWTRNAANCRDADFIKNMLISSSVLHLMSWIFGIWLLVYRNRGFNRKIFKELFTIIGTGIQPKPMDCLLFFFTVASFIKIPANMVLIFDLLSDAYWLRVALEQLYWVLGVFAFFAYFVGLLYAMPVTTREGIFAVYQPETAVGSKPLSPIHVLTPTTIQKNVILIMGAVYPTLFGAGLGIASGAMHDQGNTEASRILMICQYANWVLIMYVMAVMLFYYGLKYKFILRANIIIAEAALKTPRTAFGISNLKSRSPARFLFVQLKITGVGGGGATVLAGSLCLVWALFRIQILSMKGEGLPHIMAFFWTCAMAATFFIIMGLITTQTVRSRRRGSYGPSTNNRLSSSSHGGTDETPQRRGSIDKNHQNYYNKGSKENMPHLIDKQLSLTLDDLEAGGVGDSESEHDLYRVPSLTPPPRPCIQSFGLIPLLTADSDPNRSRIRESVFGRRTSREDKRTSRQQLPTSRLEQKRSGSSNNELPRVSTNSPSERTPTNQTTSTSTTGSSRQQLPSSRLEQKRSDSRNNALPRVSTNSSSERTPTHQTTSISTTTGSSSRLWRSSNNGSSTISAPPPVYNPSHSNQQQQQPKYAKRGAPLSTPISASSSRASGGYR
ncbi:hypothetical protein BGZ65_011648 [Modicella reniformis]|uniref:Uncharacterized protein n=1 Tax=Modicella reniformis TaxID=1440133 RepID=A0A9P6IMQ4_9FUNG|nr:hypothetical protein BGZ65_011648 [Modicella reniformis]